MSEQNVSLSDYAWAEVPDLVTLPAGEEVLLVIQKGEIKLSDEKVDADGNPKKGLNYILAVEGRPEVAPIFYYLSLPDSSDEASWKQNKMRRCKKFWEAFGINPNNPGDLVDHAGKTAYAVVGVEDWQGEERNTIKSFTRSA